MNKNIYFFSAAAITALALVAACTKNESKPAAAAKPAAKAGAPAGGAAKTDQAIESAAIQRLEILAPSVKNPSMDLLNSRLVSSVEMVSTKMAFASQSVNAQVAITMKSDIEEPSLAVNRSVTLESLQNNVALIASGKTEVLTSFLDESRDLVLLVVRQSNWDDQSIDSIQDSGAGILLKRTGVQNGISVYDVKDVAHKSFVKNAQLFKTVDERLNSNEFRANVRKHLDEGGFTSPDFTEKYMKFMQKMASMEAHEREQATQIDEARLKIRAEQKEKDEKEMQRLMNDAKLAEEGAYPL